MKLKKLGELLPILGVFLIILGYLKLYFYYDHWNIAIIDYLDFSEITLLFLSDVHIILAFIGISLFPLVIGLAVIQYFENRERKKLLAKETQPVTEPVAKSDYHAFTEVVKEIATSISNEGKGLMMIICLIFSVIAICFFYNFNKIWLLYLAIANFMQFMLVFTEYIFDNDEKLSEQVTFIVTAIAFSVFVSHYDICKTELNSNNCEVTIVTETENFKSSADYLYIGKTNNYIFIYDKKTKTSKVLKSDAVKEMQIKGI